MDEAICTKCGKVRYDKIFGYIDDPCQCDHSDEEQFKYQKNKVTKGKNDVHNLSILS